MAVKKLRLGKRGKWLGVCAGLAEYFKLDPALLRVGWIFVTAFTGVIPGLVVYILAAWAMGAK